MQFNLSPHPKTLKIDPPFHSLRPSFGTAFDIDGVILRGREPVGGSQFALTRLYDDCGILYSRPPHIDRHASKWAPRDGLRMSYMQSSGERTFSEDTYYYPHADSDAEAIPEDPQRGRRTRYESGVPMT
eukprot:TRINITY_DN4971_c0_g1_i6.p1 TRINITY_DN4971_c0_g1~~TRINITY_DN4971_c0_g1_i6.p1  ORF type:complete len:129 (-),score=12.76 TRINITY_DN4971_c0_g1_i6:32-418(-)